MKMPTVLAISRLFIMLIGGVSIYWAFQHRTNSLGDISLERWPTQLANWTSDVPTEKFTSVRQAQLTFQEAISIATAEVEGVPYSIEQEFENEILSIEVAIARHEILIDAQTGEVLLVENLEEKGDPEDIAEYIEALRLLPHATLSLSEALHIADEYLDTQIHSVELEDEDGNLVYEVVSGIRKIYIDAGNGEILHASILKHEEDEDTISIRSSVVLPNSRNDI
jgi:uncharacterized membrane protein YkoI